MHIGDTASIGAHINKAGAQGFFLPKNIPLLEEVGEAIALISGTAPGKLRPIWGSQLKRVTNYADITRGTQRIWNNAAPPEINPPSGRIKSVAISPPPPSITTTSEAPHGRRSAPTASPGWATSHRMGYALAIPPWALPPPPRGDLS